MVDTQHFCLRWNNYQSSITTAFENLRDDEDFVDVTLACDGKSLKAHRVVLSACSPYFRELLKSTPCKHPVIVLQDVAFTDLHALVEFIYHGEVNVHQRSLSSFLKTAEVLRVSGLTQNDDAQGPILQSLARASTAAPSPHTPPHPAHTPLPAHPPHTPHPPLTPSYTEKLEDALLYPQRRVTLPPRRLSRAESSPDIKRARHDNNNDQIHDFSTKGAVNNNGNGVSNSSSSPSPRLMDEVKHEPLDMCPPDAERDDTPPHTHHRPHGGGPPSRGSSAEADDRTPPPLPHPPFISPAEKLFGPQHNFSYSMSPLTDASLAGLPSPLAPDGMASTSQAIPPLRMPPPTAGGINEPQECPYCRRTFSCYYSLKRHFQDKHEQSDTLYVCEFCHRRYRTKNSLTTHKSLQHRGSSGMLKRLLKTSALHSALAPAPHHLFDLGELGERPQLPPGLQ
ncbi:broad-complex core protein isoforms 1/2/3/4/5 isoform X2 [Aricia agestis]|uniref:broad-complex core protein isoforms 1/2/3/4/5 isoform X2 n=1 Tax=Aricia agestis TaxID=91739 RepID=UPI001C2030AD|nr:broad-complex core protein isoforms 1/2/3/4/5 isoform X2 [Aricia agestis]